MSCQSCKCNKEACNCTGSTGGVRAITFAQLKAHLDDGKDFAIINVLSKEHYADCHIPGSQCLPLQDLKVACTSWDKDKYIAVYCASYLCGASKEAAKMLTELGFKNVWAYEGGTKEWKEKGMPCEGACEMDYLK